MRQVMKIGVLLPVAVLLVSGCATKGFVRDMFAKKDVEIDQRFVKVAGQVEGVNTEVKGVTTPGEEPEGAVADAGSGPTGEDQGRGRGHAADPPVVEPLQTRRRPTPSRSTSASTRPSSPTGARRSLRASQGS